MRTATTFPGKMATLNLYVSDELKEQMAEHRLNWSRIAAEAFTTAIELERIKQMISTEEASILRLRASRDKGSNRREAEGIALGKQWANDSAEFDELERVAALADEDWSGEPNAYGWADPIVKAVYGPDEYDRTTLERFAEQHLGQAYPPMELARGFAIGAGEVFDKV